MPYRLTGFLNALRLAALRFAAFLFGAALRFVAFLFGAALRFVAFLFGAALRLDIDRLTLLLATNDDKVTK